MTCADGELRCADESVFLGVAFYDFTHVRTCACLCVFYVLTEYIGNSFSLIPIHALQYTIKTSFRMAKKKLLSCNLT